MKLTALAAFMVGGAGLLQVGALPIRVLVVTSSTSTTGVNTNNPAFQHLRFGHAVPPVAWLQDPHAAGPVGGDRVAQHRRPCGGRNRFKNRVKAKTLEITNFFRGVLGLPLKEPKVHHHHPHHGKHGKHHGEHHGKHHEGEGEHGEVGATLLPVWTSETHPHLASNMGNLRPGMLEYHHSGKASCFGMRLHRALMALGPWEGRALAFVLGCGIGVLLRMFWVFAVVMYRFAKGPRTAQAPVYSPVLLSGEDVLVPPPTYVFEADVKTPVVFEDVKTPIVEDVKTPVGIAEEAKKIDEEESK